jgi:hypothetical protein
VQQCFRRTGDYWFNKIRSIAPDTKIIKTGTFCDGLFDNFGNKAITGRQKVTWPFRGIGRPQSFYAQLADNNCKVVDQASLKIITGLLPMNWGLCVNVPN